MPFPFPSDSPTWAVRVRHPVLTGSYTFTPETNAVEGSLQSRKQCQKTLEYGTFEIQGDEWLVCTFTHTGELPENKEELSAPTVRKFKYRDQDSVIYVDDKEYDDDEDDLDGEDD